MSAPVIEREDHPWHAGEAVRLVRPDNADHPRRGRVGTVESAKWYPPVEKWRRGVPHRVEEGTWLLWVRFAPEGDVDRSGGRLCGLFGREVSR